MKNMIWILSLCILLLALSACDGPMTAGTSGSTPDSTQDGTPPSLPSAPESIALEFQLTASKDAYAVTGIGDHTESVVVIPETYNGLPVTEIADEAFIVAPSNPMREQCAQITEVYIPAPVARIGEDAFNKCRALKTVILQSGVAEISGGAFYGCVALVNITLPDSLRKIGESAFCGCRALKNIIIPEGVTALGRGIFMQCSALETITVPGTVTEIPENFARNCHALCMVELGGSIQKIGDFAFDMCTSLKKIDLGNKLEVIGQDVFDALKSVILPDTLKHIGKRAFSGCALRSINIPSGIETMADEIFLNCKSLKYNVSKGGAYLGNKNNPYMVLVTVDNPDVKNLVIHDDTQFVLDGLFNEACITSLSIGKNVKYISSSGLGMQTSVTEIHVSPQNENYHFVDNCLVETKTKTLVRALDGFVIPDDGSVTVIGYYAGSRLENLIELVIPDSIVEVGDNAFAFCSNLQTVLIGSGVRKLGADVFYGCGYDTKVYYRGSEADWEKIDGLKAALFGGNGTLLKMPRYYYHETKPTEPGNYWHYVDGKPTLW